MKPGTWNLEPPDWTPQSILDAGDQHWASLSEIAQRCCADLETGQVLAIISSEPSIHGGVAAWCVAAGHELLRVQDEGRGVCFWIRMGMTA